MPGSVRECSPRIERPESDVTLLVMRIRAAVLGVVLATLAGMTASSAWPAPATRIVPCDDIIGRTDFPYLGNSRPEHRSRLVLGVASVPPAYMRQVVPTGQKPWAYWRKHGLVVRATGAAVTITVPRSWRTRAAITWGNNHGGAVGSLRIAGCRVAANVGNAYAGGFYVRLPACVPLVFTVGKRSATMLFGVGKRCRR